MSKWLFYSPFLIKYTKPNKEKGQRSTKRCSEASVPRVDPAPQTRSTSSVPRPPLHDLPSGIRHLPRSEPPRRPSRLLNSVVSHFFRRYRSRAAIPAFATSQLSKHCSSPARVCVKSAVEMLHSQRSHRNPSRFPPPRDGISLQTRLFVPSRSRGTRGPALAAAGLAPLRCLV